MRFLFAVALAASIGFVAAWAINHNRYGYRDARFGPFDRTGAVTVENVEDHVLFVSAEPGLQARVQLLSDAEHDFGVMAPGAKGEHSFRIKNSGGKQLGLRIGASTCKCTVGDLEKSVLQPGEETDVTLAWTVRQGVREFSQSAQLITTDPLLPAVTLQISGSVIGDFEFVPETWSFREVASGEPFEITGEVYNFTGGRIQLGQPRFSSDQLDELSEFTITEVPKAEFADSKRADATECFRITARVKPGLRQGAISQNLLVPFQRVDVEKQPATVASTRDDGDDSELNQGRSLAIPTRGRVVGMISMIESTKLRGESGGGYLYDFGRIGPDDSLTAKAFVVLKGDQRESTKLSVGQVDPSGVVEATLSEPKGRGSMVLHTLNLKLSETAQPSERLGKNKDDYGTVWIESDNPKVPKMRVLLKFAIEPR